MDCENQEKDKDGNPTAPGSFNNANSNNSESSTKQLKTAIITSASFITLETEGEVHSEMLTVC